MPRITGGFALLALISLCAVSAQAAGDTAPAMFSANNLLKLLLSLALIIAMILALAWYARRLQGFTAGGQDGALKILAATPVGAKERVVLLKVEREKILLGVTPGQVVLLARLNDAGSPPGEDFAAQLERESAR